MKKLLIILIALLYPLTGHSQLLKRSIPDKLVVLTFDDATASQYSVVAPLLKKFHFGATFFICEFMPNFKDTSKYMNWRQIQALDRMGFEVANHTRSHPAVSHLSGKDFVAELRYIEDKCDSLGIAKPSSFAYPGYDLSLPVLDTLNSRGYLFARAGGARAYDPKADHPLIIPSWAMSDQNEPEIMEAFTKAVNGHVVVLTIHGVPDAEHPWVNTSPELFHKYMKYLSDNHYKVIALRDLKRYIDVKYAMKTIMPDLSKKYRN
jgi:peptidoglycan-N-acetylglucosamine deacetylase